MMHVSYLMECLTASFLQAMQTGMPEFLEPVLVGRIVEKEHNGEMVKGEVSRPLPCLSPVTLPFIPLQQSCRSLLIDVGS